MTSTRISLRPYRPRTRLSPGALPFLNRLSLARHPIDVAIEGFAVSLSPGPAIFESRIPAAEDTAITLTVDGGETVEIVLPAWVLDRIADRIQPGLGVLPPGEAGEILIELALAPLLDAAEAAIGRRISIIRRAPGPAADGVIIPFDGRFDGAAFALRIALGPEAALARPSGAAALLLRVLDTAPARAGALADLPMPLDIVAGRLRLSAGQIRSLQPGDALLPDVWCLDRGFVVIALGETHAARGVPGPEGIECSTGLRPATEIWPMTFPDDAETQEAGDAEGLEAVTVTLTFHLGRRSVDLGSLHTMGPGTVFDLGLDHAEAVEIRANGTRIAQGEIVEIGERLGVRIVRLAGQDRGE